MNWSVSFLFLFLFLKLMLFKAYAFCNIKIFYIYIQALHSRKFEIYIQKQSSQLNKIVRALQIVVLVTSSGRTRRMNEKLNQVLRDSATFLLYFSLISHLMEDCTWQRKHGNSGQLWETFQLWRAMKQLEQQFTCSAWDSKYQAGSFGSLSQPA